MIVTFTLNTTILTDLTVYTMYAINVSAVSSGGVGPANTAKARTDAAGTEGFIYHWFHDTPHNQRRVSVFEKKVRAWTGSNRQQIQ